MGLKLLFLTRDFTNKTEKNMVYLTEELRRHSTVAVWHEDGHIHDILARLSFRPDFILQYDLKESRAPQISGLSEIDIPMGVIKSDDNWNKRGWRQFIEENRIRVIFPIIRHSFLRNFPEYENRMMWLPHSVNTKLFKDYGLTRDVDLLMMGKLGEIRYPLRTRMYETFKNRPGFVYHPHPGYREHTKPKSAAFYVGEDYAREMNRAKIFLTCHSVYRYVVMKYYEALACKTLLLAPHSEELESLGFLPNVHFVPVDEHDFEDKANYYLKHKKEREQIAAKGYEMVHTNHSTEVRAAQLIKVIKELLKKR